MSKIVQVCIIFAISPDLIIYGLHSQKRFSCPAVGLLSWALPARVSLFSFPDL